MGEQVETAKVLSEMMHWLAHLWGCQTNPRKRCPTKVTSCQTPGILLFLFFSPCWSWNMIFLEWDYPPGERYVLNRHDWGKAAFLIKMKGLLIQSENSFCCVMRGRNRQENENSSLTGLVAWWLRHRASWCICLAQDLWLNWLARNKNDNKMSTKCFLHVVKKQHPQGSAWVWRWQCMLGEQQFG